MGVHLVVVDHRNTDHRRDDLGRAGILGHEGARAVASATDGPAGEPDSGHTTANAARYVDSK
jgi:hypothetical protein